ncbi:MAG: recombination mediator RecR [Patescibacteria group bacterium]|jgi:recombination protein RecR
MRKFPVAIHHAVSALGRLPGVGPKTALRYAFALLRFSKNDLLLLSRSIVDLTTITTCKTCFTYAESDTCDICADSSRDVSKLCIVAEARDIATLEATSAYKGKYFVLGGVLNPIDGMTPETLNIHELVDRLKNNPSIHECILAFSPDVHGETTILYLARLLEPFKVSTTRLARGLPMGADIEYADEVTLASAISGRSKA